MKGGRSMCRPNYLSISRVSLLALVVLTMILATGIVSAHQNPPGCSRQSWAQSSGVVPSGAVCDGATLSYDVFYSNNQPPGGCDVGKNPVGGEGTGLDANIDRPGNGPLGGPITTLTTQFFPFPTAGFTCPGDSRCQTAGPYIYVVRHQDEDANHQVQALFNANGTLHKSVTDQDFVDDHQALSTVVVHPGLTVTKSCQTVGRTINVSGTVCNANPPGSPNAGTPTGVPVNNIVVNDDQIGPLPCLVNGSPAQTLAPGECCSYSGSYSPTGCGPHTDTVTASASTIGVGDSTQNCPATVSGTANATCSIPGSPSGNI